MPPYPAKALPNRVRCARCEVFKPLVQFSATQKEQLRTGSSDATCLQCGTRPRKDELQCCYCGKLKDLDAFTKVQRKEEEPRCNDCIRGITAAQPGNMAAAREERERARRDVAALDDEVYGVSKLTLRDSNKTAPTSSHDDAGFRPFQLTLPSSRQQTTITTAPGSRVDAWDQSGAGSTTGSSVFARVPAVARKMIQAPESESDDESDGEAGELDI